MEARIPATIGTQAEGMSLCQEVADGITWVTNKGASLLNAALRRRLITRKSIYGGTTRSGGSNFCLE